MGVWGNVTARQKRAASDSWLTVLFLTCGIVVGPVWYEEFHATCKLMDSQLTPCSTGYLIQNKGWRSAFYLLAATHLGLFFAHLFFGPETLYPNRVPAGQAVEDNKPIEHQTGWREQYFAFKIHNRKPFDWQEIWRPFAMAARPIVLLSAFSNALPVAYMGLTFVRTLVLVADAAAHR